jgi:ATP-dependent Clp protease ATP-binding subunit ClpA
MTTKALNQLTDVIRRAMENGALTPTDLAVAIDSAQLLQSPEAVDLTARLYRDLEGARLALWEEERDTKRLRLAAKLARVRAAKLQGRVAQLEAERHSMNEALAELEAETGDGHPVDEDPIAYALTEKAGAVSDPRRAESVRKLQDLLSHQRVQVTS